MGALWGTFPEPQCPIWEQGQEQGQEQGEEQKEESEDEEDVPLAVLKQRRDAAYTAAKQKKREEKKK